MNPSPERIEEIRKLSSNEKSCDGCAIGWDRRMIAAVPELLAALDAAKAEQREEDAIMLDAEYLEYKENPGIAALLRDLAAAIRKGGTSLSNAASRKCRCNCHQAWWIEHGHTPHDDCIHCQHELLDEAKTINNGVEEDLAKKLASVQKERDELVARCAAMDHFVEIVCAWQKSPHPRSVSHSRIPHENTALPPEAPPQINRFRSKEMCITTEPASPTEATHEVIYHEDPPVVVAIDAQGRATLHAYLTGFDIAGADTTASRRLAVALLDAALFVEQTNLLNASLDRSSQITRM